MATTNQPLDVNEALNKSEAYFVKNKKLIIGAIVALFVIVGGFFAYSNLVAKPNKDKANTMLAKGQQYFAQGKYDEALNGDKAGYIGFLEIAKKYNSTDAGNLAKLYAGLTYAEKDDVKNAIKFIESFKGQGDAMISPAAIAALGNCYAKDGQIDKAIELLKKAADKADNKSLTPIFLVQAAKLLVSQNKLDEAKAIFESVKTKYATTPEGEAAEKLLQHLAE